jgi:hypothetical protein
VIVIAALRFFPRGPSCLLGFFPDRRVGPPFGVPAFLILPDKTAAIAGDHDPHLVFSSDHGRLSDDSKKAYHKSRATAGK